MQAILIIAMIIAMLWAKYTERVELFDRLRIVTLIAVLILAVARLMR
jgi:hypothetical protein